MNFAKLLCKKVNGETDMRLFCKPFYAVGDKLQASEYLTFDIAFRRGGLSRGFH